MPMFPKPTTPFLFYLSASKGYMRITRLLLEHRAPMDAKFPSDLTSLHIAANEGHVDVVCLLLKYAAAQSRHDDTPLLSVTQNGHFTIYQALLCHNASLANGSTKTYVPSPLYVAASENRLDIARLLLEQKANPNGVPSLTPLFIPIEKFHVQMTKLLLEYQANVEMPLSQNCVKMDREI